MNTDIIAKFNAIKERYVSKKYINNIILFGNNSITNELYLNYLIELLFGKITLRKNNDNKIDIYSCKYYIKFRGIKIQNDDFVNSIREYVQCKKIIDLQKIFVISDLDKFSNLSLIYIKNIIEKHKVVLIGSSNRAIDNISYHKIFIKYVEGSDDKLKYSIYYDILTDFYNRINNNNFISYTEQLTKQLNKYLYDFCYFIKVCFDFFKDKCRDKYKLIALCADAERNIIKYNVKSIYLNKFIFNVLELSRN